MLFTDDACTMNKTCLEKQPKLLFLEKESILQIAIL